jgi:hypothetical protein
MCFTKRNENFFDVSNKQMSIQDYYLIFAEEIKINIKNATAFFNAMQTSCIKNRCMMDVLKVILFCSWGWSTRCARFPIYPTYKIKSHF